MDIVSFFLKLLSLLILIVSFFLSLNKNKDFFSPIKIYIVFLLFFYADIYFSDYEIYIYFIYLINALIIAILTIYEPKVPIDKNLKVYISDRYRIKIICFVWFMSLLPILNQLYLIHQLGGLVATVANIGLRVKYFEGKGYIPIINNLIVLLNILYFITIVNKPTLRNIFFYLIHFSVLVMFGLLSGSRSFIIMTVLILFIISNYYGRRISFKWASILAVILLVGLALLGFLRNNVSTSEGTVSINQISIKEKIELSHFKYGLIPLEIIFEANDEKVENNLQYGLTYLSLVTNFIPRKVYPDKLDSGGIFFTKVYTDNKWGGYSNLATGAVTEGIINYGFILGTVIGFLLISTFYFLGIYFYRKFLKVNKTNVKTLIIIPYIYFVLVCARFSFSEFSYIIFNYILTVLLPFALFLFFIRLSISKKLIQNN